MRFFRKSDPTKYYKQGLALARSGDIEAAIECFKKVIDLKSPLQMKKDCYFNLGKAYEILSQYHQAVAYYDKTIEVDHQFSKAYCNRGAVHIKIGEAQSSMDEYERAISDLSKAISLDPNDWIAYYNRATALDQLSRHKEANKDLKTILDLAPPNHPNRAYAEKALHKDRKEKRSPKLEMRRKKEIEGLIKRITELNSDENFKEAAKTCDQAMEKVHSLPESKVLIELISDEKAFALAGLGHFSEALYCCEHGIEANPNSARLWNTKGLLLAQLSKPREAIKAFQKYISIAPPDYSENVEKAKMIIQQLRGDLD